MPDYMVRAALAAEKSSAGLGRMGANPDKFAEAARGAFANLLVGAIQRMGREVRRGQRNPSDGSKER